MVAKARAVEQVHCVEVGSVHVVHMRLCSHILDPLVSPIPKDPPFTLNRPPRGGHTTSSNQKHRLLVHVSSCIEGNGTTVQLYIHLHECRAEALSTDFLNQLLFWEPFVPGLDSKDGVKPVHVHQPLCGIAGAKPRITDDNPPTAFPRLR